MTKPLCIEFSGLVYHITSRENTNRNSFLIRKTLLISLISYKINNLEVNMAFSEKIKIEVKEKAAFRCCRCLNNIGIDVHHIIPEKNGGTNDFENAAPLCQNCHDQFGDNPSKRKEIRQMRDWWYKIIEKKYSKQDLNQFNEVNLKLEHIQDGQYDQQKDIQELKEMLKNISDEMINGISPSTASSTASSIVNSAMAVKIGPGIYSNFFCPNCNTYIGLLIGTDVCPNCKTKIK